MINSLRLSACVLPVLRAILAALVSLTILVVYPVHTLAADGARPPRQHSIHLVLHGPQSDAAWLRCFALDPHYRGIEAALDQVNGYLMVRITPDHAQGLYCPGFAPVDTERPTGLLEYATLELTPDTMRRYVFQFMLRLPDSIVNMAQTDWQPACWSYNGSIGLYSAIVAPVLNMGGLTFVVLTPPWDIGLYCLDVSTGKPHPAFMPTWVEDHDPSTWLDPGILIMNPAPTRLITLNKDRAGTVAVKRVVAIGTYDRMYGGNEPFAVTIPYSSETGAGDGPARLWSTNAPAWANTLVVTYADGASVHLPVTLSSR